MSALPRALRERVLPAITAFGDNPTLSAIRAGMVAVVPLTIIGGLFMIAAHLPLKLEQKQEVLEMFDVKARLDHLLKVVDGELDILQVEKRIRGRVKRQMEKSQREYYLNEQVKAIQKELGEGEEGADHDEIAKRIKAAWYLPIPGLFQSSLPVVASTQRRTEEGGGSRRPVTVRTSPPDFVKTGVEK